MRQCDTCHAHNLRRCPAADTGVDRRLFGFIGRVQVKSKVSARFHSQHFHSTTDFNASRAARKQQRAQLSPGHSLNGRDQKRDELEPLQLGATFLPPKKIQEWTLLLAKRLREKMHCRSEQTAGENLKTGEKRQDNNTAKRSAGRVEAVGQLVRAYDKAKQCETETIDYRCRR